MKVWSANRGLNIATGIINIIMAVITAIFGFVMALIVGLAYGLSGGLSQDPEVIAEAERVLGIVDAFSIVCIIAVAILFVCAIFLFIPKIRYKFILSMLSILSLLSVCVATMFFPSSNENGFVVILVIMYGITFFVSGLHLANILVKGEFRGKLLNDVTAYAKADASNNNNNINVNLVEIKLNELNGAGSVKDANVDQSQTEQEEQQEDLPPKTEDEDK